MIQLVGDLKWVIGRHWSQYTNVFTDLVDGNSSHPYEKPESLIKRLIMNHTDVGDIVCDPFCGSGTIPRIAKSLGRRYVASEINNEIVINV